MATLRIDFDSIDQHQRQTLQTRLIEQLSLTPGHMVIDAYNYSWKEHEPYTFVVRLSLTSNSDAALKALEDMARSLAESICPQGTTVIVFPDEQPMQLAGNVTIVTRPPSD